MRLLRWIDDALLDRVYQPICDALSDRVGDVVDVARACIVHTVGLTMCATAVELAEKVLRSADIAPILLGMGSCGFISFGLLSMHRSCGEIINRTGPNALRLTFFTRRVALLCYFSWEAIFFEFIVPLSAHQPPHWLIFAVEWPRDILLISIFYLMSCQNRPPQFKPVRGPAYT